MLCPCGAGLGVFPSSQVSEREFSVLHWYVSPTFSGTEWTDFHSRLKNLTSERLLLKLLARWLDKRGLIRGCDASPLMVKQKIHISMEEVRAMYKTSTLGSLGSCPIASMETSAERSPPDAQDLKEKSQVDSLKRWIYHHREHCKWENPSCSWNSLQREGSAAAWGRALQGHVGNTQAALILPPTSLPSPQPIH